jgi:two-component system sensor histidine kinase KdpD
MYFLPTARAPRGRLGAAVGTVGLLAVTAVLLPVRADLSLAGVTLVYLVPVLAAALAGGMWPALVGAVVADLLVNFLFVPPYHTLRVDSPGNVLVLVVYLLVAATVAIAVEVAARQRAAAGELAEIDRLRAALLDAVGHDLRTPLAGIKAAVSSLRQPDIDWVPADRAELLATVEESADRLVDVVENLLSVSRLRAGVLSADPRPVAADAVVAAAVLHTSDHARIAVAVPDDLPLVMADPGLLERVVANLLANAVAASPADRAVRLTGRAAGDRIELAVVDHGPGLPAADRERLFAPFQRRDDQTGTGLGLGLAIARGFTEAMGGTLTPVDTAGGGLTMTISLPAAS